MDIKQTKKKFLLMFLFILLGVVALLWGTFETTSSNSYCSSCHMMKPEVFTWQASSHSHVACVGCHVEPGFKTKIKYKLVNVKEWIATLTGNYGIVITSTTPISDATCTQCHDMNARRVTPSGDLIIPHGKHLEMGVSCTLCHTGIAHGNIATKRVTFRTDYVKWDVSVGKSIMSDVKNLRPTMEVCMNCHKVRKAPLDCSTCHTSSMIPIDHKEEAFKNGVHGAEAAKDIQACDACHSYMSKDPVEVSKGSESTFQKFLAKDNGKSATISVSDYVKANTYCRDCHGKRPSNHDDKFQQNHGVLANQNKDKCFTCHDNRTQSVIKYGPQTTVPACGNCHTGSHNRGDFLQRHPVPLPPNSKLTITCYTCHNEQKCSSCHKVSS